MKRFQQTKQALGSTIFLTTVLEDTINPDPIFSNLWGTIAQFEQRFSRFLPTSELSKFNQSAGKKTTVSPEMRDLLSTAKAMAQKTAGLYNPFILPALQRAGYKGSWPHPSRVIAQLDYESRIMTSHKDIIIGPTWATIPKNTALDFGGIGKGYLLDKLSRSLQTPGIVGYWLSLGGDILCSGLDESSEPWDIAIQDALHEDMSVANITNGGETLAIATSGITKRKGMAERGPWHHLIDPRTNEPATTNILTATTCCTTATDADVFAKCLVILGSTSVDPFIQKTHQHTVLLQLAGNSKEQAEIKKIGAAWLA